MKDKNEWEGGKEGEREGGREGKGERGREGESTSIAQYPLVY